MHTKSLADQPASADWREIFGWASNIFASEALNPLRRRASAVFDNGGTLLEFTIGLCIEHYVR
jgi:hypothetical protein